MKLPIVKSMHIEAFTGAAIDEADYFNRNAIMGTYDDGRLYATQRPSVDIFDDASVSALAEKGRGIYFWRDANDRYIVIDDKIYKNNTASVAIATISSGTKKVFFVEMVNWLVILDPENNEGWYIEGSSPWNVVGEITAAYFPPKRTPAVQLTGGGAFLDGRLYVGGTDGAIYGSDANTPVTWTDPLNKISAEREADSGVYVDKHMDHVVMFGTRTIEFFFNNANPTGSPLSRRTDVFHNMGIMQGDAAWREGDDIYFVAVVPSGPLEVKRLVEFMPQKISTPEVDSFITNSRLVEDVNFVASGLTTGGRTFYILTFYTLIGGVVTPSTSIAFDGTSWGCWCLNGHADVARFPLIGWTIRSGSDARSGEGVMSNGDVLTINDDFTPIDTLLATGYIEDDYIEEGYYSSTGGSGTNIQMTVRTGPFDGDTNRWKFAHTIEIVGDETASDLEATVKWADGNSINFNAGRTINLSRKEKITRMGRFKRRNHEVVFEIPEQYRIEALELDLTGGGH